eukprot:TRINITY_DN6221_c0_g5_i3.p1 TRINITY_DN6221_c0_g5~~TRINITY_DN6221_c0_g5_i3.p1  ORF type:complete len:158 (-),score=28.86 TRINITY_DN6221_c0_g5_i3:107-580(-)
MSKPNQEGKTEAINDPYAEFLDSKKENKLEPQKAESARARKLNLLKSKFHEMKGSAYQGFIMGSMIGGGFGLVFGLYNAVVYRSFLIIPVATLTSAASFGFFLACGSLIRGNDVGPAPSELEMRLALRAARTHRWAQPTPFWVQQMRVYNEIYGNEA